jgi:CRISPR-associated protein Cpf1
MTNIFEGMTNLYSLSKTLRFELKPVGKTLENIKKNEILIRDEQRDKDYPTIKLLFDTLHNKFIKESLEQLHTTNREDFSIFYKEYKKKIRDKKNLATKEVKDLDDELQNRLLKLRKEVCALYTTTAELRKTKVDFLDEK